MGYQMMTDLMVIKGNNGAWSPTEYKEILAHALEIYFGKQHKMYVTSVEAESSSKKRHTDKEDAIVYLGDMSSSCDMSEIESKSETELDGLLMN